MAAEAEKLRARISNMEVELSERKKDSARVVESVKTQAIFNVSGTKPDDPRIVAY